MPILRRLRGRCGPQSAVRAAEALLWACLLLACSTAAEIGQGWRIGAPGPEQSTRLLSPPGSAGKGGSVHYVLDRRVAVLQTRARAEVELYDGEARMSLADALGVAVWSANMAPGDGHILPRPGRSRASGGSEVTLASSAAAEELVARSSDGGWAEGRASFPSARRWDRGSRLGRGMQGEVWEAVRSDGAPGRFALKRMFNADTDAAARRAGEREAYFGKRLRGVPGCSQFVEHFWASKGGRRELWLVFRFAGRPLSQVLYDVDGNGMLRPSELWMGMHSHFEGMRLFRSLANQLLRATAAANERGVLHRDIKPGNVLISPAPNGELVVTLADWSSAVNLSHHNDHYGPAGPTQAEETLEYSAPEVRLSNATLPFARGRPLSYDAWAAGATLMELLIGAKPSQWMSLTSRELSKLQRTLKRGNTADVPTVLVLTALQKWCLWGAASGLQLPVNGTEHAAPTCPSARGFRSRLQATVNAAFTLNMSFKSVVVTRQVVDLVFRLLQFDAYARLSATDSLGHKFFADQAPSSPWHSAPNMRE